MRFFIWVILENHIFSLYLKITLVLNILNFSEALNVVGLSGSLDKSINIHFIQKSTLTLLEQISPLDAGQKRDTLSRQFCTFPRLEQKVDECVSHNKTFTHLNPLELIDYILIRFWPQISGRPDFWPTLIAHLLWCLFLHVVWAGDARNYIWK